jgi:hypothetical protein
MKKILIGVLFCVSLLDFASAAALVFERAIWIPYWRKTEGASTTLANLNHPPRGSQKEEDKDIPEHPFVPPDGYRAV